ncbi:unnamed protein product [Rhizophagus irregularis]|uniref:Uncharacterized protein n=1 Tax=Rhizophagus irregularis TaxID=588596 RepID=A0A915YWW3_9GLOM|nr:unnamed protein product [Rhizophagus irregularis]
MTGKSWKTTEIIKVLEFINENFSLWCKHRINACTKVAKVHNLDRDAKSIYSMVNKLLQAIKTPKRRKACKTLKRRKISSLVKEINKKTEVLDEGLDDKCKGKKKITSDNKQKITTNSNTNMTTNANQKSASQAATTSASQIATTFANQAATTSASQVAATFASQAATSSASQAATTSASQVPNTSASQVPTTSTSQITSVIEGVYKEKVKQIDTRRDEDIQNITQYTTDIVNSLLLKGILK